MAVSENGTRSASRSRSAADQITDAYFELDEEWRFQRLNDRAEQVFGRPKHALSDRVIWDEFPGTRETDLPEEFYHAARTGEPRTFEVFHQPRDATLEVHAFPMNDGLAVTIHERDGQADDREGRRSAMVATADAPMFALNGGARFVDVNQAFLDLTGRPRSELIGTHVSNVVDVEDETPLRSVLARGERAGPVDLSLEGRHGDRRRCRAAFAPDPTDDGALVCTMRDVTEERRRKRRLDVFERLLGNDLRDNMADLHTAAEQIGEYTDDEQVAQGAEAIAGKTRSVLSLSRIVNQFGDAIDPDMGDPCVEDAVDRVRDAVDRVRADYPDAVVQLIVKDAAEVRVHESTLLAVRELVENAAKHTDDRVRVTVSATDDRVRIEISDRGEGLSEEAQAVLTAEGAVSPARVDHPGLWMVNWAVSKSGGRILADGSDGTTVGVELPEV